MKKHNNLYNFTIISIRIVTILLRTILFFFSYHPLLMALLLILFTLASMQLISLTVSRWVSISIILIFLGGMIVIFIFMASLCRREKIFIRVKNLFFISMTLIFLRLGITVFFDNISSLPALSTRSINIYFSNTMPNFILVTFFLLITLFSVIKITEYFKGALSNYK